MTTRSTRRVAVATLGGYLVFLAWILLWPSAGPASSTVDVLLDFFWEAGYPQSLVTGPRVEFVLNAFMLAPVPLLATWAGVRWTWERWTACAFIASGSIELVQGLLLPGRSAQFQDVVSNSLGVLMGAAVSHVVLRWVGRSLKDAAPSAGD